MFQRIRSSARTESARDEVVAEIDEALVLFGEALMKQQAIVSAQTSVSLLRAMIENGGLVSPVAENAIASLGPECIHQLSSQDIALALHVQAQMLPADPAAGLDIAHSARFSHLLETILARGILMDISTVGVVSEAIPRIGAARPDLLQKWQEFLQPSPKAITAQCDDTCYSAISVCLSKLRRTMSTTLTPTPRISELRRLFLRCLRALLAASTTTSSDALSRFRNVRRAGRHLHYAAYGKLITAAGKAKTAQSSSQKSWVWLRSDVPFSSRNYFSQKWLGWHS